jgi:hypothetical protein
LTHSNLSFYKGLIYGWIAAAQLEALVIINTAYIDTWLFMLQLGEPVDLRKICTTIHDAMRIAHERRATQVRSIGGWDHI